MAARRGPRVPRLTRRLGLALAALGLLAGAAGCGTAPPPGGGSLAASGIDLTGQTFTVGGKEFAEQLVLCEIQAAALRSVGASVIERCGRTGGTEQTREALESGAIDMYWSYTGTGWEVDLGRPRFAGPPERRLAELRAADAANGIAWTEPTPFDNTYAIATGPEAFPGVRTLSELAAALNRARTPVPICVEPEFATRADSLPAVLARYGIAPDRLTVLPMDASSVYQATANETPCPLGEVFSTDGRNAGLGLRVLDDDRGVFPDYQGAVSVRTDVVDRAPDVVRLSDEIARRLTDETMLGLNGQASSQGVEPRRIAVDWLRQQGLIARDAT